MRILRSSMLYIWVVIALLIYFLPAIPSIYFGIGILAAVAYQVHQKITKDSYEGPFGEEMLTSFTLVFFWLPIFIMTRIYAPTEKYLKARKGKTEWNYSNGSWDLPGWEKTSTNWNAHLEE